MYEKFDPYKNNLAASRDGFAEFCKYFILILVFFVAPGTLIYVIKQDKLKLDSEEFKIRFGSLYSELKTHTR